VSLGARWAVTGIGSLGHHDAAAAVHDVLALDLDLPFWPQLPRRGAAESMLVQAAAATRVLQPRDARGDAWGVVAHAPAALADAVARSDPRGFEPQAAGLAAFTAALASQPRAHVKGQWTGPATLLAGIALDGAVALGDAWDVAVPVLDALHLSCVAQARALLAVADRIDLWLDEPLLSTLQRPGRFDLGAARAWYARLAVACGERVRLGVHDCAGVDPALFELGVTVVSIDATRSPDGAARAALARHLTHGVVAWGAVPSTRDRTPTVASVRDAVAACTAEFDFDAELLARNGMLTTACGLAGLGPADGIERLRLARAAAVALRAR
jgi:hypothetical protein